MYTHTAPHLSEASYKWIMVVAPAKHFMDFTDSTTARYRVVCACVIWMCAPLRPYI